MPPEIHVLLVEDDDRLASLTAEYLERAGVMVTRARDGLEGARLAASQTFDALILDVMLPSLDGMAVCRKVRETSGVPIVMVTARTEEGDRVLGLELGADDYLSKPFSPRELLARIRAVVRRARGLTGPGERSLRVGPLTLHPASFRATLDGEPLDLTSQEFALLRIFVERRGRILTREQLLELLKGSADEAFDRAIDVRVSRLRQRLRESAPHLSFLRTVRGVGYVLSLGEES